MWERESERVREKYSTAQYSTTYLLLDQALQVACCQKYKECVVNRTNIILYNVCLPSPSPSPSPS
jgi:hypothetical protein